MYQQVLPSTTPRKGMDTMVMVCDGSGSFRLDQPAKLAYDDTVVESTIAQRSTLDFVHHAQRLLLFDHLMGDEMRSRVGHVVCDMFTNLAGNVASYQDAPLTLTPSNPFDLYARGGKRRGNMYPRGNMSAHMPLLERLMMSRVSPSVRESMPRSYEHSGSGAILDFWASIYRTHGAPLHTGQQATAQAASVMRDFTVQAIRHGGDVRGYFPITLPHPRLDPLDEGFEDGLKANVGHMEAVSSECQSGVYEVLVQYLLVSFIRHNEGTLRGYIRAQGLEGHVLRDVPRVILQTPDVFCKFAGEAKAGQDALLCAGLKSLSENPDNFTPIFRRLLEDDPSRVQLLRLACTQVEFEALGAMIRSYSADADNGADVSAGIEGLLSECGPIATDPGALFGSLYKLMIPELREQTLSSCVRKFDRGATTDRLMEMVEGELISKFLRTACNVVDFGSDRGALFKNYDKDFRATLGLPGAGTRHCVKADIEAALSALPKAIVVAPLTMCGITMLYLPIPETDLDHVRAFATHFGEKPDAGQIIRAIIQLAPHSVLQDELLGQDLIMEAILPSAEISEEAMSPVLASELIGEVLEARNELLAVYKGADRAFQPIVFGEALAWIDGIVDLLDNVEKLEMTARQWHDFCLVLPDRIDAIREGIRTLVTSAGSLETCSTAAEILFECVMQPVKLGLPETPESFYAMMGELCPTLGGAPPSMMSLTRNGMAAIMQGLRAERASSTRETSRTLSFSEQYYEVPQIGKMMSADAGSGYQVTHIRSSQIDSLMGRPFDVVSMDPNPNDPSGEKVSHVDVILVLKKAAAQKLPLMFFVDVTMSHFNHENVKAVLSCSDEIVPGRTIADLVKNGDLNLGFNMSFGKYANGGMNYTPAGFTFFYNNPEVFVDFNHALADISQREQPALETFNVFHFLFKYSNPLVIEFRDHCVANARRLYDEVGILEGARDGHRGWIKLAEQSADLDAGYVAIAHQSFDEVYLDKPEKAGEVDLQKQHEFNKFVLDLLVKVASDRGIPITNLAGFGYFVTNVGDCERTVRVTPGLSDANLLSASIGERDNISALAEVIDDVDQMLNMLAAHFRDGIGDSSTDIHHKTVGDLKKIFKAFLAGI
ncbi:MAG: hypothetical protein ACI9BD_000263 [Candidatus Marinamargulisbacteria bacterium]